MAIRKPFICFLLFFFFALIVKGQSKVVPIGLKDTIPLRIDSLKTAIVTALMRPRIKGDTLEYNTEHMVMQRNAQVEELLRRLPGLHIDPDGTIVYNGEKIQHLLVDGEDIFANDPTIITRNFDASKIARVQVIDRITDKAIFTGIDDGIRTKTINLVMKQSAKDAYSAKIEAGVDTKDYYNANGIFAGFKDKEQFTLLGLAANNGCSGFSSNAGGTSSSLQILKIIGDPLGANAGNGIPRVNALGFHYANTWNPSGNHFMGNYQYGQSWSEPSTSSQSLQFESDSIYTQNQQARSLNQQDQHTIYGTWDWTPTSIYAMKVDFNANTSQGRNQYNSYANSRFNDTLVNSEQESIQDNVQSNNFNADLHFRIQPSKEKQRIIALIASVNENDVSSTGYQYSLNQYFHPSGLIQEADTSDQRKVLSSHSMNWQSGVYYKEPLGKTVALGIVYNIYLSFNDPLQKTFSKDNGKYIQMIDSLSSNFNTRKVNQIPELDFQGKEKSINYTIGGLLFNYAYRQHDLIADSSINLHYTFWLPKASATYIFDPVSKVNLSYRSVLQLPSIDQLTTKYNNTNPLNIKIGNPFLKPASIREIKFEFQRTKSWEIDLALNAILTNNNITSRTTIDSLGRQVLQPVNQGKANVTGLFFSISKKLLKIDFTFFTNDKYILNSNYINTLLNRNSAYILTQGIALNTYIADKLSLDLNLNITYDNQYNSINTTAPVRYWSQSHSGGLTVFIFKDFELNSNATYSWQQKTSAFSSNTSVLIWNSYINRSFLKGKLTARFQLNNLLNSNSGISRNYINNITSQTSTNILGRYWMLSMTYHFDRKFKRKT